jgi:hypothetical protein
MLVLAFSFQNESSSSDRVGVAEGNILKLQYWNSKWNAKVNTAAGSFVT